jgi:hypothetical protein
VRTRSVLVVSIMVSVLLGTGWAQAEQRKVVYDRQGQRQGYLLVDEAAGRFDVIDKQSRRLAWGDLRDGVGQALRLLGLTEYPTRRASERR